MGTKKPKPKRQGRPPKADKFDDFLHCPIHSAMGGRIVAFQEREGMDSKAKAVRVLLEKALQEEGL